MHNLNESSGISRRAMLGYGAGTLSVAVAGCLSGVGTGESTDSDLSAVSGSFFMLYDFARQVAGEELRVEDMVPVGSHGDEWSPSPSDIEQLSDTDVFLYISEYRGWSDNLAQSLPSDYPDIVVVDAADGIDHIAGDEGREIDPHFWMDPIRAIESVETIRDGFITADPANESAYADNAAAFISQLESVHADYSSAMEHRDKDLVVVGSHDSFQYWTDQYGFEIYSPVGISPDGQPTARELDEITDIIDEHDIAYVLYDAYDQTTYADSIAAETGTETLPLSPIEATTPEQLEQGMGYVEHMIDINLNSLENALAITYPGD